jgi:hypothetical protein
MPGLLTRAHLRLSTCRLHVGLPARLQPKEREQQQGSSLLDRELRCLVQARLCLQESTFEKVSI